MTIYRALQILLLETLEKKLVTHEKDNFENTIKTISK